MIVDGLNGPRVFSGIYYVRNTQFAVTDILSIILNYAQMNLEIDTNKKRLNIAFIHQFLSNAYWAEGRSMEIIKTCIDHSLNFGVYLNDRQIGYARVATDYGVFAYIMDVFIDEAFRGMGYSKQLIHTIIHTPELSEVKIWRLATKDAHGLYKKLGFTALKNPDQMMELINP